MKPLFFFLVWSGLCEILLLLGMHPIATKVLGECREYAVTRAGIPTTLFPKAGLSLPRPFHEEKIHSSSPEPCVEWKGKGMEMIESAAEMRGMRETSWPCHASWFGTR